MIILEALAAPTRFNSIEMPAGAKILTAQAVGVTITLWAEADPVAAPVFRRIAVIPTGDGPPDGAAYVATVWARTGAEALHVYDCGESDHGK